MKRRSVCCLYFVAIAVLAAPAAAELIEFAGQFIDESELAKYQAMIPEAVEVEGPEPGTPSWGLVNWSSWNMGPSDAGTRDGVLSYNQTGNSLEFNGTSGTASFSLPVHLPQGSLVQYVYVWYYDNSSANPSMGFYRGTQTGGFSLVKSMDCGDSSPNLCTWSGGAARGSYGGFSHTTNNWTGDYFILALFGKSSASVETRFYQATVWYKLQISPAPGTARFDDVPVGSQFFREIEALADSGITLGCTATNYCPGSPVTRGQMAAFLARAFGLAWPADQ